MTDEERKVDKALKEISKTYPVTYSSVSDIYNTVKDVELTELLIKKALENNLSIQNLLNILKIKATSPVNYDAYEICLYGIKLNAFLVTSVKNKNCLLKILDSNNFKVLKVTHVSSDNKLYYRIYKPDLGKNGTIEEIIIELDEFLTSIELSDFIEIEVKKFQLSYSEILKYKQLTSKDAYDEAGNFNRLSVQDLLSAKKYLDEAMISNITINGSGNFNIPDFSNLCRNTTGNANGSAE